MSTDDRDADSSPFMGNAGTSRRRRLGFLLRLVISVALLTTSYWLMPHPRVMQVLLALAAALAVMGLYCRIKGRTAHARVLFGFAAPIVMPVAIFWAMGWPQLWQSAISAFEKADQASPPRPGVIVFIGSSSMRHWQSLVADMQPLHVVNRAFGGSQLSLVTFYAPRIVIPYRPRAVVLYAGDNDLSFPPWKSPETVLGEFKEFVHLIHRELPETWIYYISMKPAPWGDWPLMDRTNHLIESYIHTQERVQYLDVSGAMLDAQGNLRRELYDWDPMHMNQKGYALWTAIVRPVLMERLGSRPVTQW